MSLTNETVLNCSAENSINATCFGHGFHENSTSLTPLLKDNARALFLVALVLAWINVVLTLVLNLTVIIVICSYEKRSRLYLFLLNLAIADLAGGVLDALPHALERSLGLEHVVPVWEAGTVFCKIQRTVAQTCLTTSSYILAAMSVDRAYVICKPLLNMKRGSIIQKAMVLCCWLFCFLCSSPSLKYYEARNYLEIYSFSNKQQCIYNFGSDPHGIRQAYKIDLYLKFGLMFLVPLLIVIVSYTMLVRSIYRRSLTPSADKTKAKMTEKSRLSRVFNGGVSKSKLKSIKLTFGIVLSFLVCWTGYFIGYFLAVFLSFDHPMMLVLTTFYYWNSIANPIMFFVYHRKKVRRRSRDTTFHAYTSEPHHSHDICVPTHLNHIVALPNTTESVAV